MSPFLLVVCWTILCCQEISLTCRLFEWNCEAAVEAQELFGNTPVKDSFDLLSIRITQWNRYAEHNGKTLERT